MNYENLRLSYCGIPCESPFFLASSPVSGSYDMVARAFAAGWAGAMLKTVASYLPEEVSPRLSAAYERAGRLAYLKNAENVTQMPLAAYCQMIRRLKAAFPEKVVVASIMGESEALFAELAMACADAGADMLECNFSCPHTGNDKAGSVVGEDAELVGRYTAAVRAAVNIPVIAKLTPNVTRMNQIAKSAAVHGANSIAAINTVKSLVHIAAQAGGRPDCVSGLSGAAIKPIALRFHYELASDPELGVPLSAVGGIETWHDALDFLLLGCRNLQICTAVMQYGYRVIEPLRHGLATALAGRELESILGTGLRHIVHADELVRGSVLLPEIDAKACLGCGRCYVSCRDGAYQAITFDSANRRPAIDTQRCVGCHLCKIVCPAGAIRVP